MEKHFKVFLLYYPIFKPFLIFQVSLDNVHFIPFETTAKPFFTHSQWRLTGGEYTIVIGHRSTRYTNSGMVWVMKHKGHIFLRSLL